MEEQTRCKYSRYYFKIRKDYTRNINKHEEDTTIIICCTALVAHAQKQNQKAEALNTEDLQKWWTMPWKI